MTATHRPHLPAGSTTAGHGSTWGGQPAVCARLAGPHRAGKGLSLDDIRVQRQRDVERRYVRTRLTAGIAVAALIVGGEALWFAFAHRGEYRSCLSPSAPVACGLHTGIRR
jgi:hypothetical protein